MKYFKVTTLDLPPTQDAIVANAILKNVRILVVAGILGGGRGKSNDYYMNESSCYFQKK